MADRSPNPKPQPMVARGIKCIPTFVNSSHDILICVRLSLLTLWRGECFTGLISEAYNFWMQKLAAYFREIHGKVSRKYLPKKS